MKWIAWLLVAGALLSARAAERPNILWITSEDNGPHLGCYGDTYADTPHLDRLAGRALRYLHAWSSAPVCAPARTTIISGVYPTSTGSEHMRSEVRIPAWMKMYPQYLREAGYYCTNNSKEDYNLESPGKIWDESSPRAHWNKRPPGQPFFAVFNHTVTHESQIRARPHQGVHDPAKVRLPAYHPDRPEVRQDWAQYYDKLTEMDALVGKNLKELEEAGLAEETIVFYYGDHGAGMPRSKRWPYHSGLHVPLIVHVPDKWKHLAPSDYVEGGTSRRLVGFIDLAPTVLSLAGVKPPEHMQGGAFMGPFTAAGPDYQFGFRGRMDERYDLVRSAYDGRFVYIRNYMPHRIYGQYLNYMFQTPTTRVWKELYDAGKLQPPQTYFWETKPAEELYDLEQDPDEIHNLAGATEHEGTLRRFRAVLHGHLLKTRDVGFLPEAEMHRRSKNSTPYEIGHDPAYGLERILEVANGAASYEAAHLPALRQAMKDEDGAIRYWGIVGLIVRGESAVRESAAPLRQALADEVPVVRIAAAEALARFGEVEDWRPSVEVLLKAARLDEQDLYVSLQALNAVAQLGPKLNSIKDTLAQLPTTDPTLPAKLKEYVPRMVEWMGQGTRASRP